MLPHAVLLPSVHAHVLLHMVCHAYVAAHTARNVVPDMHMLTA